MKHKIEVFNCPDLYAGVDELVSQMEDLGLGKMDLETPICIIVKSTGEVVDGKRMMNAFAYIDTPDSQIIDDLEGE